MVQKGEVASGDVLGSGRKNSKVMGLSSTTSRNLAGGASRGLGVISRRENYFSSEGDPRREFMEALIYESVAAEAQLIARRPR